MTDCTSQLITSLPYQVLFMDVYMAVGEDKELVRKEDEN